MCVCIYSYPVSISGFNYIFLVRNTLNNKYPPSYSYLYSSQITPNASFPPVFTRTTQTTKERKPASRSSIPLTPSSCIIRTTSSCHPRDADSGFIRLAHTHAKPAGLSTTAATKHVAALTRPALSARVSTHFVSPRTNQLHHINQLLGEKPQRINRTELMQQYLFSTATSLLLGMEPTRYILFIPLHSPENPS